MSDAINLHDLSGQPGVIPPALLERTESDLSAYLAEVAPIVEAVRRDGDAALIGYARTLDGVTTDDFALRVTEADFAAAIPLVPADVAAAIAFASANIRRFHQAQMPPDLWWKEVTPGVFAGDRVTPIDSVACYVPRGKGSFPSVAMMTAIPALVAGVGRTIILTPPGPDGTVDPGTLVAAHTLGVGEVYKIGGAQAVAAVAHGTATVPRCLKIVGPSSPYGLAAKRLLVGRIDPGIAAGPSEAIVLADDTADGRLVALDLLIESEHGADSSSYLVTPSRAVAEAAMRAIPELWAAMGAERAGYSRAVLSGPHGGIVITADLDHALAFINAYAPEHLQVLTREPMALLGRIRNAGEILLGTHTPGTLANFLIGPNAVLPTGGAAKTIGPLSVFDFLKRSSVAHVTGDGFAALAGPAETLARYEGFPGHARAVSALRGQILAGSKH